MDFNLTEERQMLQDTLRRYLTDRYTTEQRNQIVESDEGFSPDIWSGLADLGVIGALLREADGGIWRRWVRPCDRLRGTGPRGCGRTFP